MRCFVPRLNVKYQIRDGLKKGARQSVGPLRNANIGNLSERLGEIIIVLHELSYGFHLLSKSKLRLHNFACPSRSRS